MLLQVKPVDCFLVLPERENAMALAVMQIDE